MGWLIDYDSTLANTFQRQVEELNKEFGTNYTEEDFKDWGMINLPQEQIEYLWSDDVFLSEEFQMSCQPLPGAIEKLSEILDWRGEKAYVISDRPQVLYGVTREWLDQQGLGDMELIFTRSPHSKSDQNMAIHSKSRMAYYKRLKKVVEDAPHHSLALAQRSYIDKVYLLDKANNRHIEHPKIQRIVGWEEIE